MSHHKKKHGHPIPSGNQSKAGLPMEPELGQQTGSSGAAPFQDQDAKRRRAFALLGLGAIVPAGGVAGAVLLLLLTAAALVGLLAFAAVAGLFLGSSRPLRFVGPTLFFLAGLPPGFPGFGWRLLRRPAVAFLLGLAGTLLGRFLAVTALDVDPVERARHGVEPGGEHDDVELVLTVLGTDAGGRDLLDRRVANVDQRDVLAVVRVGVGTQP